MIIYIEVYVHDESDKKFMFFSKIIRDKGKTSIVKIVGQVEG